MRKELVTIIVPIYNAEKTINHCLESILNQKYDNYEVLMINDGSVDDSAYICKRFSSMDKRFKYYEKENGGVSSARNYGLNKAKGMFISFIDADDLIDPNFLSIAIDLLHFTNSDIFICNFNFIHKIDYNIKNNFIKSNDYSVFDKELFLQKLVDGSGIGSGCANKVYSVRVLNNIRFKKVAVAEDLYYNYEICKRNDSLEIVYSKNKLYYYYLNNNSIMHGKFSKKNLDVLDQYEKLIKDSEMLFKNFNIALKASYVFISSKIIIKMVSSSFYDETIVNRCKLIINNYEHLVYRCKYYSISKRLFLMFFVLFFNRIVKSYNKNNFWKFMCFKLNSFFG